MRQKKQFQNNNENTRSTVRTCKHANTSQQKNGDEEKTRGDGQGTVDRSLSQLHRFESINNGEHGDIRAGTVNHRKVHPEQ